EGHTLLPLQQVSRQPETPTSTWVEVGGIDHLDQGKVVPTRVASTTAVVCNVAGSLYAYADRCPACGSGLAEAKLEGVLLACPGCAQLYDVVRAGRGFGGTDKAAGWHLDPLPLLAENGGIRIAVPAGATS
ncbi:MAG: Rieske (2Fe-2S) protein, partial [Pseudonocardiaceae bacterium]